ncbi:MAG TPA: nucleotidyltransferase family protein [Tepidisphaeraceae bacterium]|nr:nucleotidyltransferase family protein [Tepidisphaeraceae bacterium]
MAKILFVMLSIGAIILAAGSSSRLGQTKQLLHINGESLVRRAARAALDGGCRPVVVVTGAHADAVGAELVDLPVVVSFNSSWSAGMGTSIRSGLAALLAKDSGIGGAVVLVCDQPRLGADIVRDLLSAWLAGGKPMGACEYAGTLGPPCCFDRSMFGSLSQIADADGAKKLLMADPRNVQTLTWAAGSNDIDTPEDWHRLCESPSGPRA